MAFNESLIVRAVNLREVENAMPHHTNAYELVNLDPPTPVLRRGQPFHLDVHFNRPFDASKDEISLHFKCGKNSGLPGSVLLKHEIIGVNDKNLSIAVHTSVYSPVGVWRLAITTTPLGSDKPADIFYVNKDIYLLFNPWLQADQVYMEGQLLDEYVSNDIGKIWHNNETNGVPWVFGQFDACVLPACQLMLEKYGIQDSLRGDPVKLTRVISNIVNSDVLEGRWGRDFPNGTSPHTWTGSVPILEKYLQTRSMVRYAQCWVFAGVVTTICRALGIPSRTVTNIDSAHDYNGSLSIDLYYKKENVYGFENNEYIWNFHVWNDVWMARPDLPQEYSGWQAIDATPQEESDGKFQCGPSSLLAIKQGAVDHNYDVRFMVATVNADVMYWIGNAANQERCKRVKRDEHWVGRTILTKTPYIYDPNGNADIENITHYYKYKEGSPEERAALHRAASDTVRAREYYDSPDPVNEDVAFYFVAMKGVKMGESCDLIVNVDNKSDQSRNIRGILSVRTIYSGGRTADLVKKEEHVVRLQPGEKIRLELLVPADVYLDKLVDNCDMKVCAMAEVTGTGQVWAEEVIFHVWAPTIAIQIEDKQLMVRRPGHIVLSFINPLKKLLTGCEFHYYGPGLNKNMSLSITDVGPLQLVQRRFEIEPQVAGKQYIVVTFSSEQLVDVRGSASVEVLAI